jgi:hypothetical protein
MRCLQCRKQFKPKRSDQIFCSSKCRVSYNRLITRNQNITDKTNNSDKLILSLCDYSGVWSEPYARSGYNVSRIDIKKGQDIRLLLHYKKVYGILAAPPCTDFASSGACWWEKKGKKALLKSLSIVDACARIILFAKPIFWALENPVGRLSKYLGAPRWTFNPCDYGDAYTKRTCLWGQFNVPKPDNDKISVSKISSGHHSVDYYWKRRGYKLGKERQTLRSVTPKGFAEAFFKVNQ